MCDKEGQKKWRSSKKNYLFPKRVMSKLFGKIFSTLLEQAVANNELNFKGGIAELSESKTFAEFMVKLRKKSWNVYAKEPFKGAEGGVTYLARYFSKTAIGNERILSCDDNKVIFKWRDYSDENKSKVMTLDAHEFIRRFLSHVLPDGFMRVRSFGFLANACKAKNIATIHTLLRDDDQTDHLPLPSAPPSAPLSVSSIETLLNDTPCASPIVPANISKLCPSVDISTDSLIQPVKPKESVAELIKRVIGIDIERCKHCKIGSLEKTHLPSGANSVPGWDTS